MGNGESLLRAVCIAWLVLAGCAGVPSSGDDDSMEPGHPEAPRIPWIEAGEPPVAPPDIPWLEEAGTPPMDWECTGGWRPVAEDGVRTCEPFPEEGPDVCADGEAHFPGEAGCAPIGRACGAARFPPIDDLRRDTPVVYVDLDAEPGGDGSRAAPYRRLGDALGAAPPGAELVLSRGRYEIGRGWPTGVGLRGLCARDTQLVQAAGADVEAVVWVTAGTTRIRDVSVGPGPGRGVIARGADARVELRGVSVRRTTDRGVLVEDGATLDAERLVVAGVVEGVDTPRARGVEVRSGGRLSVRSAVVEGNANLGVAVEGPESVATLEGTAVMNTALASDGEGGSGLQVQLGAQLTGVQLALLANAGRGVAVFHPDTVVALGRSVVRDMRASAFLPGFCVAVDAGATTLLDRVVLDRCTTRAIAAFEEGTRIEASRVLVRDVRIAASDVVPSPFPGATAVWLWAGAAATLDRAVVSRASVGAEVLSGARLRGEDILVDRVTTGLLAAGGGSLELSRTMVRRAARGVDLSDTGTRAKLSDTVVRDTEQAGLWATRSAVAELERVVLDRNAVFALVAAGEARVELHLVRIRDSLPAPLEGRLVGRGIQLLPGGAITGRRVIVEGHGEIGIAVDGAAELALEDAVVRNARGWPDGDWGRGVSAAPFDERGFRLRFERVVLARNREMSAFLSGPGSLELIDVLVRDARDGGPDGAAGVVLRDDVEASVERLSVERTGGLGLGVFFDSEVRGRDLAVRDIQGPFASTLVPVALDVAWDSRVTVTGMRIENVAGRGLTVSNGSAANVDDVRIQGVRTPTCAPGCSPSLGVAVAAVEARLDMRRFRVDEVETCALFVGDPSEVDLVDGAISGSDIGVCLQAPAYDVSRLVNGVEYTDNGVQLQTTGFAVPVPTR